MLSQVFYSLYDFFRAKSHRVFSLREFQRLVAVLTGLVHVFFLVLFWWNGITIMAVCNAGSILCYIAAFFLAGEDHALLYFRLIFSEVLLHTALALLTVGDSYGFTLFAAALVPVSYYFCYLFSLHEQTRAYPFNPLLYSLIALGVCLMLKVYGLRQPPLYAFLTEPAQTILYSVNLTLTICTLILFMSVAVVQITTMQEQLMKYATEDPLTGLANRRGIEKALNIAQKTHLRYAVILCDIDDFKKTNDAYGHE